MKSSRLPDKCQCSSNVRPLKKPHEECVKAHSKKENVFEDARNKRHSKAASNVRTDNRRMTGNVNIYICSEATENTQVTLTHPLSRCHHGFRKIFYDFIRRQRANKRNPHRARAPVRKQRRNVRTFRRASS